MLQKIFISTQFMYTSVVHVESIWRLCRAWKSSRSRCESCCQSASWADVWVDETDESRYQMVSRLTYPCPVLSFWLYFNRAMNFANFRSKCLSYFHIFELHVSVRLSSDVANICIFDTSNFENGSYCGLYGLYVDNHHHHHHHHIWHTLLRVHSAKVGFTKLEIPLAACHAYAG